MWLKVSRRTFRTRTQIGRTMRLVFRCCCCDKVLGHIKQQIDTRQLDLDIETEYGYESFGCMICDRILGHTCTECDLNLTDENIQSMRTLRNIHIAEEHTSVDLV